MTQAYNSRSGALWVQPGGPNSPVYFLGCHDLDAIAEPRIGGKTPIRKFNPSGNGWLTVGTNRTPPDSVTASITGLLLKQKDWLEKLDCPFNLFVLMRSCGPADIFTSYDRGFALRNADVLTRTYENLVRREEETESTVAAEISADPGLTQIDPIVIDRLSTAEINSFNSIWTNKDLTCFGDCGDTVEPGDLIFAAADSAVGPATGNVFYSIDGGVTFTVMATDPFAAGFHVMAVTSFMVGAITRRVLVSREGLGATQGQVAYTDNNGASWTVVSIGGAAVGHGCTTGRGLFALDSRHIWLASADGYIYFSEDGGATWTAVEAGVIAVTPYTFVHFSDANYGIAGSAADVIVTTRDGGVTWTVATATGGAGDMLCGYRLDSNRLWLGDDDGKLWFSRDNGVTWTQRTGWTGSGVGDVMDISFVNDIVGYMASNSAAPVGTILRTIDGGYTWSVLATPTNLGLNDIDIGDSDIAFVAGEIQGALGVILSVHSI
jgi:photosystem II stability/assembly factor-like uncharacterized protein